MNASPYIREKQKTAKWTMDFAATADYGLLFLIFVASAGSFFKVGIASPVWGVIYLVSAAVFMRDANSLLRSVGTNWILFLFPLVCLISVLWSIEPGATLRHALQFGFTALIAFWIGSRFSVAALFHTLAAALLACVFVSVIGPQLGWFNGYKQDDYIGATRYFTGLYTQKNVMGVVLIYAAVATLVSGMLLQRRMWSFVIVAALLPIVILTKSTTALLLYFMACSFVGMYWFLQAKTARTPLILVLLIVALMLCFYWLATDANVLKQLLGLLGKDTTLTGRTIIWDQGGQLVSAKPWLGLGYQAFWESPTYAGEVMLIRAAVLESIGGFHNGYLETLVSLGLLGGLVYVTLLLFAQGSAWAALYRQLTPTTLGIFYVVGLILIRTFTESALYFQHDLEFILLIALIVSLRNTATIPKEGAE